MPGGKIKALLLDFGGLVAEEGLKSILYRVKADVPERLFSGYGLP